MKTTFGKILEAMEGLNKISDVRRGPATSRKLFGLKMALTPSIDFLTEEEEKIIIELNGTPSNNGTVAFSSEEIAIECRKRRDELLKMEEDVNIEKIDIHDSEIGNISSQEMWLLREFINFVE